MDYIISNKSLLNQKIFTKIIKKMHNGMRQVVILCCGLLLIGCSLWTMRVFSHFLFQQLYIILGILLMIYAVFEYRIIAAYCYKREKAQVQNGPLQFYTRFLSSSIEVTDPTGARTNILYRDVKKIQELSDGLLIWTKEQNVLFLDKDGYTFGNQYDVMNLLSGQCSDLQIKKGKHDGMSV